MKTHVGLQLFLSRKLFRTDRTVHGFTLSLLPCVRLHVKSKVRFVEKRSVTDRTAELEISRVRPQVSLENALSVKGFITDGTSKTTILFVCRGRNDGSSPFSHVFVTNGTAQCFISRLGRRSTLFRKRIITDRTTERCRSGVFFHVFEESALPGKGFVTDRAAERFLICACSSSCVYCSPTFFLKRLKGRETEGFFV
uniref:Uncharacterized protein n=1 Tax=Knipowitschia caucasica TaxID=637954 RepID=A0AAV2L9A8_KNICA